MTNDYWEERDTLVNLAESTVLKDGSEGLRSSVAGYQGVYALDGRIVSFLKRGY